jgi:hypothetical protein
MTNKSKNYSQLMKRTCSELVEAIKQIIKADPLDPISDDQLGHQLNQFNQL